MVNLPQYRQKMCHSSVQSQDFMMRLKAFNTVKEDEEEDEVKEGDD